MSSLAVYHQDSSCGGSSNIYYVQSCQYYLTHKPSMLAFLVAMTWVFFDGTDNGTKSFLAALLSCLFFITSAVLVMEGATSGAPGTVRHRISVLIVKMCTIRPARWKRQMDWCFDTLSSVFRRVRNPATGAAHA